MKEGQIKLNLLTKNQVVLIEAYPQAWFYNQAYQGSKSIHMVKNQAYHKTLTIVREN